MPFVGRVVHEDLITGVLCLSCLCSSVIKVLDRSVEPYSISRFYSILSLGFMLIYIERQKTKTKAVIQLISTRTNNQMSQSQMTRTPSMGNLVSESIDFG